MSAIFRSRPFSSSFLRISLGRELPGTVLITPEAFTQILLDLEAPGNILYVWPAHHGPTSTKQLTRR